VLPLAALAAFLAAVASAPSRRRALLWVGVATAVVGGLVAASVPLARTGLLSRLDAARELSTEQVRDAAGEVYDAYSAGLLTWALVLVLAGIAVAAAALAAGLLRRGPG
jgi:predicted membrane-bound spermidine synthase